jgi:hypothetical protein
MHVQIRPLGTFPPEFSQAHASTDPFRAPLSATLSTLERELRHLGASVVAVEIAIEEHEINSRTGWPKANARPQHPGCVISFESKHGPLRYGTDAFPQWQSNLRAIALGLESLRRVERYGIGRRGEQYQGWKALPSGDGDAELGRELIDEHGGISEALKATHPDRGGDPDEFRAVQAYREHALADVLP